MKRAYFDASAAALVSGDPQAILGTLTENHSFTLELTQRSAWQFEISHLQALAGTLSEFHLFLEFLIPRMGKRADAIIIYRGIVFVIEYKVGEALFTRTAIDQVVGYALDLKNFHETSHALRIVPILVATDAPRRDSMGKWADDQVMTPVTTNGVGLAGVIKSVADQFGESPIDAAQWAAGRYKPTPTIVEAAQALYQNHSVEEISRSESGEDNLIKTSSYVDQVIVHAKENHRKVICFVTGVPGAGKTLAGLSIANSRMRAHDDEHAVFLSGNGPLVDVLREALAADALERSKDLDRACRSTRQEEFQRASAFIQNIHHFRDDSLVNDRAPVEKVVVWDEAQRAWNLEKTRQFMKEKKGRIGFAMSEPQFLLSVMDRHHDWCAVICLIGGGQEINTGEAGLVEWLNALAEHYPNWNVHLPEQILGREYLIHGAGQHAIARIDPVRSASLHLDVSMRSFRAEKLSEFVAALIDFDPIRARDLAGMLPDYPIFLTRDLPSARQWLRQKRRGPERAGLLASSNAIRLKPEGIFVRAKIEPTKWFLKRSDDIRSSDALEDAGTEFDVQGLELDWTCVCWDANLRAGTAGWETLAFKGSRWQCVNQQEARGYLLNAYRVLLTRARQGMVIFVPKGDRHDQTRSPIVYDDIHAFPVRSGLRALPAE